MTSYREFDSEKKQFFIFTFSQFSSGPYLQTQQLSGIFSFSMDFWILQNLKKRPHAHKNGEERRQIVSEEHILHICFTATSDFESRLY